MNKNKIVLVTGTFNLLHRGHIELLAFASKFGYVVVGTNADWYLKEKYGAKAVPLNDRVYCLKACRYVDEVQVFLEREPSKLIKQLKPDYYIKGPDYAGQELPEQLALDKTKAELIIHQAAKKYSSSKLMSGLIHESSVHLDTAENIIDKTFSGFFREDKLI